MAAARIKDWTISSTKYDALKYHSGYENLKTVFFLSFYLEWKGELIFDYI